MPIKNSQAFMDIANRLRIHSIKSTSAAKSGHPTTCSSIAEIMAVLFFHTMRYKISDPRDPTSDRLVLSKGHAAPILYAAWAEAGLFPVSDLLTLRKLGSDLEGHPTPRLRFVDVATGSLGQGLGIATGMAYVGKYFDKANYRVYCIIGDGESLEGSVWEAIQFASIYKLDNLCLIIDVNKYGQTEQTPLGHDTNIYKTRLEAFGFNAIEVDGHNVEDIAKAFETANVTKDKPTGVIAKTMKGKHFRDIEDKNGWHGKILGDHTDDIIGYIQSLISPKCPLKMNPISPCGLASVPEVRLRNIKLSSPPSYKPDEKIATRSAYGTALVKLAKTNPRVIALDGDLSTSTFSEKMKEYDKDRFIECFIMEQNLVAAAIGAACRDRVIAFASTFGAFFTRSFDHIRMGAISQSNVNFCGSHAGVSIGNDGPSQMALEDLAMFRSVPGCTVFYPSDAVACERAVELAANTKGITYIRTSRPQTLIVYPFDKKFEVGIANILKKSNDDKALVIGAGITLHEALSAADELAKKGIAIRVMDPFTIKPIDKCGIIDNAKEAGNIILTVEDHYPEGGLGESVLSAVSEEKCVIVKIIAVRDVPRSGSPEELLDFYGLSSKHIVSAVQNLIKKC